MMMPSENIAFLMYGLAAIMAAVVGAMSSGYWSALRGVLLLWLPLMLAPAFVGPTLPDYYPIVNPGYILEVIVIEVARVAALAVVAFCALALARRLKRRRETVVDVSAPG